MQKLILVIFFGLFLLYPQNTQAKIGVGVGTGKIQVDEVLYPGVIYELPSITVINTGDEPAKYEVVVSQRETQPELKPDKSWISYSPKEFDLEPGEIQVVAVKIDLPINASPGEYFAFLEAHPIKAQEGGTAVSIAAASKLYFRVDPANFAMGAYYKLTSLWRQYAPWTNIVAAIAGAIIIWLIVKRFIHVDIAFKKKQTDKKPDKDMTKVDNE